MSQRATPETDAAQHEGLLRGNPMPTRVVNASFCRKLERERDEWAAMCGQYKQERNDAREMLQQYMFDRSGTWIDFLPADKPAP